MPLFPWRGPKRFASPAERLTRLLGAALVAVFALVGCNASEGGPLLPRPVLTVGSTTTTTPPVTTTTETAESGAVECSSAFCLVYHIDPAASWSDGDPVVAADFAHTIALQQDPDVSGTEAGYHLIESIEVLDDKTIQLSFSSPYGAWQTLFARVYREGETPGAIEGLSTTGPFTFEEWTEGDHLSLARDSSWWSDLDPLTGERVGDVEEITFVFIENLDEMLDALEGGDVDVISARPDVATVERLREMEEVAFTLAPGPFWEHIDFHHDDVMLSQRWVRQVLSLAIDREKILDRTVRLLDPAAEALNSTVFMGNTQSHEPHFEDEFDPERAERILADNDCAPGDDGIYVCGTNRMSFVWASTNDDPARADIFESVREDLAAIGTEVRADLRSPSEFVTREFLFGSPDVWQLVNFSWRARPDPLAANATYFCGEGGDLNVNRYCSEEVESLIRETETIVEPSRRADAYNRAARLYLEDLAVIPLYQKPVLMAWSTALTGPEPNYSLSSDLWNVASWSGKDSVVVALPAEPVEVDPLSLSDDNANVVIGALMYGAFGMNPSHEYLPVLVDSVEIVEGEG